MPAVEFGTEYAANVAAAATSTQRQAGTVSMVRDTTIEQESTTTQTLQQDGPGREQQTIVEQATTNIHEEYTATYNDLAVSGLSCVRARGCVLGDGFVSSCRLVAKLRLWYVFYV